MAASATTALSTRAAPSACGLNALRSGASPSGEADEPIEWGMLLAI
ncbi:MAG: hypothetical protein WDN25_22665 [Acetobacteraceae bacterium]